MLSHQLGQTGYSRTNWKKFWKLHIFGSHLWRFWIKRSGVMPRHLYVFWSSPRDSACSQIWNHWSDSQNMSQLSCPALDYLWNNESSFHFFSPKWIETKEPNLRFPLPDCNFKCPLTWSKHCICLPGEASGDRPLRCLVLGRCCSLDQPC